MGDCHLEQVTAAFSYYAWGSFFVMPLFPQYDCQPWRSPFQRLHAFLQSLKPGLAVRENKNLPVCEILVHQIKHLDSVCHVESDQYVIEGQYPQTGSGAV